MLRDMHRSISSFTCIPTGHTVLDNVCGGWPEHSVTELLVEQEDQDEVGFLLPTLAQLSQQQRRIVWLMPPYIPYAPLLASQGVDLSQVWVIMTASQRDALWVAEQCLASGVCGALLAWFDQVHFHHLRRLQLAAQRGQALGFIIRALAAAQQPSPVALRLKLARQNKQLTITVLKSRQGYLSYQRTLAIGQEDTLPTSMALVKGVDESINTPVQHLAAPDDYHHHALAQPAPANAIA